MTISAPDSERAYQNLQLLAHAPALFNAVVAALELGVLDFLSTHPAATADAIGRHTGVPAHQLRVLLLALCAMDLVTKRDGTYRNAPVIDSELVSHAPHSWRHIFIGRQRTDYHGLASATSALRSATNTGLALHPGAGDSLYERLAATPEAQESLYRSITAFTERTAPALVEHPELSTVRHLLDVGGGSGAMSRRFLAAHPRALATVYDLPGVVELAERRVPAEFAGRLRFRSGDMFVDELPAGRDAILFCHVLEVFSADQIGTVLARAHATLPAGGRAFVYAFTAPDEEDGGVLAAQLSLYLNILATGRGMAYPVADFASWLRRAGFADVTAYPGLPYEHGLVVGRKA